MSAPPNRYRGPCECGEHCWSILTRGYVAFVSPEDAHHLQGGKWYAIEERRARLKRCYAARCYKKGKSPIRLHCAILGDSDGHIDHKDHDGLNNRRSNLRPCTPSQNYGNGRYQSGESGFRGVHRLRKNRWRAWVSKKYLGTFDTPEAAARAYDEAALKHFGEFATLNFPPQNTPPPRMEWRARSKGAAMSKRSLRSAWDSTTDSTPKQRDETPPVLAQGADVP
jgi:hypothetical protein